MRCFMKLNFLRFFFPRLLPPTWLIFLGSYSPLCIQREVEANIWELIVDETAEKGGAEVVGRVHRSFFPLVGPFFYHTYDGDWAWTVLNRWLGTIQPTNTLLCPEALVIVMITDTSDRARVSVSLSPHHPCGSSQGHSATCVQLPGFLRLQPPDETVTVNTLWWW